MKLAVMQHAFSTGGDEMSALLERTKDALQAGIDFLVLPERPVAALSEADSDRFGVDLVRAAESAQATIVGTNIHQGPWPGGMDYVQVLGPGGDAVTSLQVGPDRPDLATGVETAGTCLGAVAVLTSNDCFLPLTVKKGSTDPLRGVVMQVSATSDLEREAIRELALARSEAEANFVVVASLWGRTGSTQLRGGAAIMLQGEVLAEASDGDEIICGEIEPDDYVDLKVLHHAVRIPELLKQKLQHL